MFGGALRSAASPSALPSAAPIALCWTEDWTEDLMRRAHIQHCLHAFGHAELAVVTWLATVSVQWAAFGCPRAYDEQLP